MASRRLREAAYLAVSAFVAAALLTLAIRLLVGPLPPAGRPV